MKTYWTSGVMIEVTPKPGDKIFYSREETDTRIAELTGALRAAEGFLQKYEARDASEAHDLDLTLHSIKELLK